MCGYRSCRPEFATCAQPRHKKNANSQRLTWHPMRCTCIDCELVALMFTSNYRRNCRDCNMFVTDWLLLVYIKVTSLLPTHKTYLQVGRLHWLTWSIRLIWICKISSSRLEARWFKRYPFGYFCSICQGFSWTWRTFKKHWFKQLPPIYRWH